jgi:hypothetical protein
MSGYCDCKCRDCFEIAISGADGEIAFCNECEESGCSEDDECLTDGAYGFDESEGE